MDNKVYVGLLLKKRKVDVREYYVCEAIGPIVGVLFGSRFLSSRNKAYLPLFKKKFSIDNELVFDGSFDYKTDTHLDSSEEYLYTDVTEVDDIGNIESIINNYKDKYKDVCYFFYCESTDPYMIRYKKLYK